MKVFTLALLFPVLSFARGPKEVTRIYSYTCDSTFFEGEGVSTGEISCVPGQHLGVLSATRTFYVYRSVHEISTPAGDEAFPSDVCKRNNFLKTRCTGTTLKLAFGLSTTKTKEFPVEVQLSTVPGKRVVVGYGAVAPKHGECPSGLVKARVFSAELKSVSGKVPNSLPLDGSLDAQIMTSGHPSNYVVSRQPNAVPCDATTGDCTNATFAGKTQAASIPYKEVPRMVLCVVPASKIAGEAEKVDEDSGNLEPAL